jgi:uncharacterized SAM-binding protein YcdF (DUF218 family)
MRYIVILSCGIVPRTPTGKDFIPGTILQSRLDAGLQLYLNPPKQNLLPIEQKIIISGGDPTHNGITEAEVMADYLISRGVPKDDIIEERYSNNTIENISNVMHILKIFGVLYSKNHEMIIVTSEFHMKRVQMITRHYFDDHHLNVNFKESNSPISQSHLIEITENEIKRINQLENMIAEVKTKEITTMFR